VQFCDRNSAPSVTYGCDPETGNDLTSNRLGTCRSLCESPNALDVIEDYNEFVQDNTVCTSDSDCGTGSECQEQDKAQQNNPRNVTCVDDQPRLEEVSFNLSVFQVPTLKDDSLSLILQRWNRGDKYSFFVHLVRSPSWPPL
jgi:hypothetical protein